MIIKNQRDILKGLEMISVIVAEHKDKDIFLNVAALQEVINILMQYSHEHKCEINSYIDSFQDK